MLPSSAVVHTLRFEFFGKVETKANFRKSGKWRERWKRIKEFESAIGYEALDAGARQAYRSYAQNPIRIEVILFNQRKNMDLDGAQKSLWDALEGIAYENDKQVQSCEIAKLIDGDGPRVKMTVKYLEAA